jgi:cobaltochelatase CobN
MRNIVERPDGGRIHVARMQGQLFVCADGCCCGRVQDGYAPVPRELYHAEWEQRGLRGRVHLTIGGCLGPCALANVVMLLFKGRQAWFHSMSADGQVVALYDWIEDLVRNQAWSPPPQTLARYQFTASTWEERPNREEGRLTLPLQVQEAGGGPASLSQERTRADGRRSRRSRKSRAAASVRPERK